MGGGHHLARQADENVRKPSIVHTGLRGPKLRDEQNAQIGGLWWELSSFTSNYCTLSFRPCRKPSVPTAGVQCLAVAGRRSRAIGSAIWGSEVSAPLRNGETVHRPLPRDFTNFVRTYGYFCSFVLLNLTASVARVALLSVEFLAVPSCK